MFENNEINELNYCIVCGNIANSFSNGYNVCSFECAEIVYNEYPINDEEE